MYIWQFALIRFQCPAQCRVITFGTLNFGNFFGQCPASLPDSQAHCGAHWGKDTPVSTLSVLLGQENQAGALV